jgi:hypothetical protein
MVKGFLFDRVNMGGYGAAIYEAAQLSVDIHARPALSPLTVRNNATLGAKKAFDDGFLMEIALAFYIVQIVMA